MIKKIEIVGDGVELGEDIKKYIIRKVSRLDRFVPRHARKSMHAEVRMRENSHKTNNNNKYECEVVIHVPHEQIMAKEATLNMFAAVDIVETKLKNQLFKYKAQVVKKSRFSRTRAFDILRRLTSGHHPARNQKVEKV